MGAAIVNESRAPCGDYGCEGTRQPLAMVAQNSARAGAVSLRGAECTLTKCIRVPHSTFAWSLNQNAYTEGI